MKKMIPKNPMNDKDVDGNTMAWMAEQEGFEACPNCHDYVEDYNCEANND